MVIRTRYSIGDIVWFMKDNKVKSAAIGEISYSTTGELYSLSYKLKGYMECLNSPRFSECQLFETKEDLIDSL